MTINSYSLLLESAETALTLLERLPHGCTREDIALEASLIKDFDAIDSLSTLNPDQLRYGRIIQRYFSFLLLKPLKPITAFLLGKYLPHKQDDLSFVKRVIENARATIKAATNSPSPEQNELIKKTESIIKERLEKGRP